MNENDTNTNGSDYVAALKAMQTEQAKHQSTCPHCGYCPHCGRSAAPLYPITPWYPQPPFYPTWINPFVVTSGTQTIGYYDANNTGTVINPKGQITFTSSGGVQ